MAQGAAKPDIRLGERREMNALKKCTGCPVLEELRRGEGEIRKGERIAPGIAQKEVEHLRGVPVLLVQPFFESISFLRKKKMQKKGSLLPKKNVARKQAPLGFQATEYLSLLAAKKKADSQKKKENQQSRTKRDFCDTTFSPN